MSTAPRVLSLYRAILRLGRSWKGEQEVSFFLLVIVTVAKVSRETHMIHKFVLQEKQYILSEASRVFRENKSANSPEEIEGLVRLQQAFPENNKVVNLIHAPLAVMSSPLYRLRKPSTA